MTKVQPLVTAPQLGLYERQSQECARPGLVIATAVKRREEESACVSMPPRVACLTAPAMKF